MTRSTTARMWAVALSAALPAAGCESTADEDDRTGEAPADAVALEETVALRATAALRDARGRDVGSATLEAANGGASVQVHVRGLAPGEHGIHVHMVGQCDAATGFESAGEHWNPTGAQHGLDNASGPHAGDLPNLTVEADSTGTLSFPSPDLRLSGEGSVLDADGAALVIHAQRDDQRTDPSGDSGDRIACGALGSG